MHHADDVALDVDRHAEHRTDAPLSEDRVYDVGVVEILDDDRTSLGGDAASETTGKRYLHALADLLLQSSCGACDEDPAILIEQQHRGGVDFQGAAYALQKLGKHVLQGHVAERGVGDAQEVVAATLRDGGAERGVFVPGVVAPCLPAFRAAGSPRPVYTHVWPCVPLLPRRAMPTAPTSVERIASSRITRSSRTTCQDALVSRQERAIRPSLCSGAEAVAFITSVRTSAYVRRRRAHRR